jgi:hypothetical protein
MLSEKGPRVVYWLGAGASANALPTVKAMPQALSHQADQIRRIYGPDDQIRDELNAYEKKLKELAALSISYGSLDTYARSLYLHEDKADELAELKLHLSMYFILAPVVVHAPPPVILGMEEYRTAYDLDPRYMGWLAVLLNNDLGLNPRVKVISWNYDFQVELALARYSLPGALDQVHERYNIYPSTGYHKIDEGNFFLAHLNGIAGQEKRGSSFHPWYRSHVGFFPDWITGLFKVYGKADHIGQKMRVGFEDRLTFAWEAKPVAEGAIRMGEAALREAEVLVIIGYSFPAFNRLIDKRLIAAFDDGPKPKRLILQNRNATRDGFLNLFDVDQNRLSISLDTNPDQFHLPNELFL